MPRVTEVIVSAGRTFNHPHESYSNLRPQVTFKAEVLAGEDPVQVTKQLQAQAEGLVEDHKRHMLQSIEDLHDLTIKQQRIADLKEQIERAQRQLDVVRKAIPFTQPELPELGDDDEKDEEDDLPEAPYRRPWDA